MHGVVVDSEVQVRGMNTLDGIAPAAVMACTLEIRKGLILRHV